MDNKNDNIPNPAGEPDKTSESQISGITPEEQAVARYCIDYALSKGATQVRVSLGKNTLDSISFLNGQADKVSHCADRGVYITLFTDGRYGGYSTNRLDRESLADFIDKALENTRMLAPDPYQSLPDPALCAKNAVTGNELSLSDPAYDSLCADDRLDRALKGVKFNTFTTNKKYRLISEECEWSDSTDDSYIVDSQGFEGRHRETSFNFWSELTVEDARGRKYSGYHWESSPRLAGIDVSSCSAISLRRAASAINPRRIAGGKYNLVVENTSASRLVSPILNALYATSIQQNNSFLAGSLGKKIFPEELNIIDLALTPGTSGSRLFDSEGIATKECPIISRGTVEMYFVNTYMSHKMSIPATVEGPSRPTVLPFLKGHGADIQTGSSLLSKSGNGEILKESGLNCEDIMNVQNVQYIYNHGIKIGIQEILEFCGEGIFVTGFNGGNCNPTTGNFSYGVEGFLFRDGRILHPVKELLITGNMITLWNSLIAAGTDPKSGTRWQTPTLAFSSVDFSA
ncbi:MAG: TldD/PmbA family protein [Bacteroidales bacterium]|nr:TldD/PmbA family protein [Bacteroidales bacterium]